MRYLLLLLVHIFLVLLLCDISKVSLFRVHSFDRGRYEGIPLFLTDPSLNLIRSSA